MPTPSTPEPQYLIGEKLANDIIRYLRRMPWEEVETFIHPLLTLEPIKELRGKANDKLDISKQPA